MQVQVHTDNHVNGSAGLTAHVESVVTGALDRFGNRVTRVEVHIGDENGHKGGEHDKRCAMEARLSGELQRALERIPERQRAALLLAELHDLTGLELAATLGVSHVAARALLTRARESLRQALAVERQAAADDEATADRARETRS